MSRTVADSYLGWVVVGLGIWLLIFSWLLLQPAAGLERASGLYGRQHRDGLSYHWTSNRVEVPIDGFSGPTGLQLSFGPARWAGRTVPTIALRDDHGLLVRFPAPDELRHYRLRLPPESRRLFIEAPVERPPGREPRWLGVTLYGLEVQPAGLPLGLAGAALPPAAGLLLAALALAWSMRRGYGAPALLFVLALLPRVAWLGLSPPGWRVDEAVSLVDAWNLARTGRDHLGNFLPLGAFEALGDWISPLLTYLEVPLAAIAGPQRPAGRLVTALVGALAAPLIYRLACALELNQAGAISAGLAVALSPWQIFMSRIALPPALVPTSWALCLLAGVLLIKRGDRLAALGLALAAGVGLYAYPTLKLAVPLLIGLAGGLALWRHGLPALVRWWPAAFIGLLLWSPFVYVTLFNPASATRLNQAVLTDESRVAWLHAWWAGYRVYFQPAFYYRFGDGSSIRGIPGYGLELWATAPLVLLGLAALIGLCLGLPPQRAIGATQRAPWLFIAGTLLLAPLAASLTLPSPHVYRAAPLAPLYGLLVGLGADRAWAVLDHLPHTGLRRVIRGLGVGLLGIALLWQGAIWWRAYLHDYPPLQAPMNQDGLSETMARAVAYAPAYDEIRVSYNSIDQPYLFVLAARPFPPAEAQQLIRVERRPGRFNAVTAIGPYRFVDTGDLPVDLPTLEAIPDQYGGPGFIIQELTLGGTRILVVRRME